MPLASAAPRPGRTGRARRTGVPPARRAPVLRPGPRTRRASGAASAGPLASAASRPGRTGRARRTGVPAYRRTG
ncbi:hypothetical protein [Streptomyces sp. BRA346]|uniref:hypothetical protein n=1 Tax=Streptomyces sp. BRA346 TaxID=2878199 RepID=UPI0040635007